MSEIAGTTRDAIDTAVTTDEGTFRFIDTAGMRKAAKVTGVEYYSYLRSVQSLDRAHVAVDRRRRHHALRRARSLHRPEATRRNCATVIAVNKTDSRMATISMRSPASRAASSASARMVIPVSASHPPRRPPAPRRARRAGRQVQRPHLDRRAQPRAGRRWPPCVRCRMKRGKRLKMYYIAQFGTSPPRFAIEVNDRTLITRDFGFFVENRLREHFGLEGVPLVIDFKGKK